MVLIANGRGTARVLVMLALLGAVTATSACERIGGMFGRGARPDVALPYRAAMKQDRDSGLLAVTVKAPGASVEQMRESVRFPVTRHCLTQRGSSSADWTLDPATGDWAYTVDGSGAATFTARCRA